MSAGSTAGGSFSADSWHFFSSLRLRLHPIHPLKESTASSFFPAVLGGPERETVQCLAGNSEIKGWRYTALFHASFRRCGRLYTVK